MKDYWNGVNYGQHGAQDIFYVNFPLPKQGPGGLYYITKKLFEIADACTCTYV